MSALDDIRVALRLVLPPASGVERVVRLGTSAARAVNAELQLREVAGAGSDAIDGVRVEQTTDFDGWDIAERKGKRSPWKTVEVDGVVGQLGS
jgi:hypothetical protein